jgi:hypothetical protein
MLRYRRQITLRRCNVDIEDFHKLGAGRDDVRNWHLSVARLLFQVEQQRTDLRIAWIQLCQFSRV